MSTRPSGRLISTTSAHDPSPSALISTSLKTQATYPPSVRERVRKYPTAVAPPISRRSHRHQCSEPHVGLRAPGVRPHRITHNTGRAQCVYTADPCNTVTTLSPDRRAVGLRAPAD